MSTDPLPSWNEGTTKQAIIEFAERTCGDGGVPIEERVAVFDNDGTLWCEKPMPIQLDFILRRLGEMATAEPSLAERYPWKAVVERDFGWFGAAMDEHYAGDDTKLHAMAGGILTAHADISVEDFDAVADAFLRSAQHPTLGRGYTDCAYVPMIELLRYLDANGFANYITSGGGRDFMRTISHDVYGIPRERVIGSSGVLSYASDGKGGTLIRKAEAEYLDDGPEKPIRIWTRTGRRPMLAAGNSNGDVPMLEFAHRADRQTMRLLVLHDDAEREFDYVTGAEVALDRAAKDGWTVASMKSDWATVF